MEIQEGPLRSQVRRLLVETEMATLGLLGIEAIDPGTMDRIMDLKAEAMIVQNTIEKEGP